MQLVYEFGAQQPEPAIDELHSYGSYPYATVPGFFDHSGSALRSIGHIFAGPKSLPPPTSIPDN